MKEIGITIYSRDECCLCDDAKEVIEETLQRLKLTYSVRVEVIDITSDAALLEKYQYEIPVITINGDFAFRYKVHPITLEKKIGKILNT